MDSNGSLKQMSQSKNLKVGHFVVEFATPGISHIMKSTGRFVLFDMEHSGFSIEAVKTCAFHGLVWQ